MRKLLLLLLLCSPIYLFAQDSLLIKEDQRLLDSIKSLSGQEALDVLPYYAKKLEERYTSNEWTIPIARGYYHLANQYRISASFDKALEYIEIAFEVRSADSSSTLSILAEYQYLRAIIYKGIGSRPLASSYAENALALMKTAITNRDTTPTNHYVYGTMLEFAARQAGFNGDYPLAFHHLDQIKEHHDSFPNVVTEWYALRTRGDFLMKQGKMKEAISSFQDLGKHPLTKQNALAKFVYNINLAIAYSKDGRFREAETIYEEFLPEYTTFIEKNGDLFDFSQLGSVYVNRILHENKRERYEYSEEYLQIGEEYIRRFHKNGKGIFLGHLYNAGGVSYSLQKKFHQADSLFRLATVALVENPDGYGIADVPIITGNTIYSQDQLLDLLSERRDSYIRAYDAGVNSEGLAQALSISHSIDTLVRLNRDQLNLTSSLGHFTDSQNETYQQAIDVAIRLYRQTADDRYLQEAYQFVAGLKSNILQRYLTSPDLAESFGVPKTLIQEKTDLEVKILVAENNLPLAQPTDRADLREELLDLNYRAKLLRQQLEEEYPAFTTLLRGVAPLDLEMAAASLQADQLLVEYFLSADSVYLFTLSKAAGLNYNVIPRPEELRDQIERVPEEEAVAKRLYQTLLAPSLAHHPKARRIQIVPDGILWGLPFQALQNPNGEYLIQQYAVSYAYAAPLLFNPVLKSRSKAAKEQYLGYGISYEDIIARINEQATRSTTDGTIRDMGRLPFAKEEVATAARILKGTSYLEEEATKASFLREAPGADILHLSMHGLLRLNPLESALVFRGEESEEYDLLTMKEVLEGSYPGKLAVLSACHTGQGPLETSEGMLSIGRAFTFAGTESTITSAWAAHDEITHDILINFYQQLREGQPKDVAMQAAINSFLEVGTVADRQPRNWANLMLIGPVEPMYSNFPFAILGAIAALLLGLFLLWRWQR